MVMMIVTKQILVYKAEPVGHALIMHYNGVVGTADCKLSGVTSWSWSMFWLKIVLFIYSLFTLALSEHCKATAKATYSRSR